MPRYRVTFTHVGRHQSVADLTVQVDTLDDLRRPILAHVRPLLASRLVDLKLNARGGDIYAGDRYAGGFDLEEVVSGGDA
jgi:hypothetical protein